MPKTGYKAPLTATRITNLNVMYLWECYIKFIFNSGVTRTTFFFGQ